MSRLVEREVTIEVDGDECDVPARCWVDVGPVGASLDGRPEVLIGGEWSEMARIDADRFADALCEQAINEEADAYNDRDPGDFAC
jgi:hypothetical protein